MRSCFRTFAVGVFACFAVSTVFCGQATLADIEISENPACWTHGLDGEKCCSPDGRHEGCFDPEGGLANPWTYRRCCRSPCGEKLQKRILNVGPGECQGKVQSDITIVTGLWELGREDWMAHARYQEGDSRAYGKYLKWLNGLLVKPQPMVLFLDAKAAAFAQRRRYGFDNMTCILVSPKEDLPQMQWKDGYVEAHRRNRARLPNDTQPEVLYENYTLVVNSKPELLACAALWNPFESHQFAWVDAGTGRKETFPAGQLPLKFPDCPEWSLCIARRMWTMVDFRSKLLRLRHGTTFDSTVLLGSRVGVLAYAMWFQWAVTRYLVEGVMDDEQSIIAEVWWDGRFLINSAFALTWVESLAMMIRAEDLQEAIGTAGLESIGTAAVMGRWFGRHPSLFHRNEGKLWVPLADDLTVVREKIVREVTDEDVERIAYAMWCQNKRYGYYDQFCRSFVPKVDSGGWRPGPGTKLKMIGRNIASEVS